MIVVVLGGTVAIGAREITCIETCPESAEFIAVAGEVTTGSSWEADDCGAEAEGVGTTAGSGSGFGAACG